MVRLHFITFRRCDYFNEHRSSFISVPRNPVYPSTGLIVQEPRYKPLSYRKRYAHPLSVLLFVLYCFAFQRARVYIWKYARTLPDAKLATLGQWCRSERYK